jgi:hypothetical protein
MGLMELCTGGASYGNNREQAPSIVRKDDNSDRWIRFEWPIRAETVSQVCWWATIAVQAND